MIAILQPASETAGVLDCTGKRSPIDPNNRCACGKADCPVFVCELCKLPARDCARTAARRDLCDECVVIVPRAKDRRPTSNERFGPLLRFEEMRRLLSNGEGYTIYELGDQLGVKPRTVLRYLAVLEQRGLPLYAEYCGRRKVWRIAFSARAREAGDGYGRRTKRSRPR